MDSLLLFAQNLPETPAGWAGWGGFLTSGGVLVWLLFWKLPADDAKNTNDRAAKDALIKELMEAAGRDREADRLARHSMGQEFQKALLLQVQEHRDVIGRMAVDHKEELDRIEERTERRLTVQGKQSQDAMNQILTHCQHETHKLTEVFRQELARVVKNGASERRRRDDPKDDGSGGEAR